MAISLGPVSPTDILATHPDVLSCYNSRSTSYNAIPGTVPLAPGANQPLTVAGGGSSTSNPAIDANRTIAGQVPGLSIAFLNPA